MVANVIGVKKPSCMEMDQWWRHWHRTGQEMDREVQPSTQLETGRVARMDHKKICAKALRCRGLQVGGGWRQLHWKEVDKDKWSGPQDHSGSKSTGGRPDMVAGEVSKFIVNADGLWKESVQNNTVGCTLLITVEAGSSLRNVERALYRWSRVPRRPMRVRHDWDGCRGCLVDKEKESERKVWRALVTPLSVSSQL